jgi:hypothetical protein
MKPGALALYAVVNSIGSDLRVASAHTALV